MTEVSQEIEDLEDDHDWTQEQVQELVDSIRRRHDMLHSEPWQWCGIEMCRLVRDHELE